ncbi:torsin interacting protein isoform X1 [Temnothorax americanus]|uniref:torsin interacting protein isoform X1 n=2 Tax=Temnothorax americanus TaxID=1964332 RepID=UPI004068C2AC
MHETHSLPKVVPRTPKCRRSLRATDTKESYSTNNNFQSLHMEGQGRRRRKISDPSETEVSSEDQGVICDIQTTEGSSEEDEEAPRYHSLDRSRTISPERNVYSEKPDRNVYSEKEIFIPEKYIYSDKSRSKDNTDSSKSKQNTSTFSYFLIFIIVILICFLALSLSKNEVKTQSRSNPTLLLTESIENIKATFRNQESDIWNDVSSAINEVISRTPKIPSIILLFAKENATMDCLATKLARASSTILDADSYLVFNPEDFGNDAGEIITILNKHSPEKKKVVMIRDILNINAEAIKALHNLCDRINPLVAEAIYILTMQTNNYQSSQKKLSFVENQIYNKLSKSIDQDVLIALVTRITDGAIILVEPEPRLRYC